MLMMRNGKPDIVPDPETHAEELAQDLFKRQVSEDLDFCFQYQLHWLRNCHDKVLGSEFGGGLYPGERRASVQDSVELMQYKAGSRIRQVKVFGGRRPITELSVRFEPMTFSFLPNKVPVLFRPDGKHQTIGDLCRLYGKEISEGAELLVNLVRLF